MISIEKIKYCKLCFEPIKGMGILDLLMQNPLICEKCQKKFAPIFSKFYIDGIKGMSIYDYDQTIREYLFQLKGAFDVEIAPIFLLPFARFLRFRYRKFILVPAPSSGESNLQRGFNHVQEIFSVLRLPIINVFKKTSVVKQVGLTYEQRQNIIKHIEIKDASRLQGKKVLLVDDVMTTGATLKAMIALLKRAGILKIEILVLSSIQQKTR